jgi:hypothetical protein
MAGKITSVCSIALALIGMCLYRLARPQSGDMARREPHLSAAYGHLEQARADLETQCRALYVDTVDATISPSNR